LGSRACSTARWRCCSSMRCTVAVESARPFWPMRSGTTVSPPSMSTSRTSRLWAFTLTGGSRSSVAARPLRPVGRTRGSTGGSGRRPEAPTDVVRAATGGPRRAGGPAPSARRDGRSGCPIDRRGQSERAEQRWCEAPEHTRNVPQDELDTWRELLEEPDADALEGRYATSAPAQGRRAWNSERWPTALGD